MGVCLIITFNDNMNYDNNIGVLMDRIKTHIDNIIYTMNNNMKINNKSRHFSLLHLGV